MKAHEWTLVTVAFLAAAVGSPTVAVICFAALAFSGQDTAKNALCATILACADSVFYRALSILNSLSGLVGIDEVSSVLRTVTGTADTLFGVLVFVLGLVAAANAAKKTATNIPVISKMVDQLAA